MTATVPAPMQSGFGILIDIFLLVLSLGIIRYIINSLYFNIPLPKDVALIREPPEKTSFSFKTRLAYINDCEAIFHEAYYKVRSPKHYGYTSY
jgi:cellobiose-specific phosphotransferase system component IIC